MSLLRGVTQLLMKILTTLLLSWSAHGCWKEPLFILLFGQTSRPRCPVGVCIVGYSSSAVIRNINKQWNVLVEKNQHIKERICSQSRPFLRREAKTIWRSRVPEKSSLSTLYLLISLLLHAIIFQRWTPSVIFQNENRPVVERINVQKISFFPQL